MRNGSPSTISLDCMFFLRHPSSEAIERFRQIALQDVLSYSELRATLDGPLPSGYNIDHNRICLGHGRETFGRARHALYAWKMFDLGWVKLIHLSGPVSTGQTVLVLARTSGLYSLSASRVLATIDNSDRETERCGFCYGTLRHHVECGEERFMVEYWCEDDSVWYDILAFSRPQHPLARLAYPLSRAAQRRFARDSKAAMLRAVCS
jgi:uncharacterized protein (UPF0548 family)